MELNQQSRKIERYRRRIGLAQSFVNISNKIWAFLDDDCEVTALIDSVQQQTLKIHDLEFQREFILTLVYAKCDAIERIKLWDSPYALASDMTTSWLVGGDFNVISYEEEKIRGLHVSLNEVDNFRHCVNTFNLFDMGFKGSIYTWWNGRADEDCIFKRLDRCLANMEFQQMMLGMEITHLSKVGSDHSPMLLSYNLGTTPIKKSFRFLNFWAEHESFRDVVKENWTADFHANPFKNASLEEVVLAHEVLFELFPTTSNRERLQKVQAELFKYLAIEEQFWKKKTGMQWFQDGNRNTKFFHAQVNGRRKRLQLRRIQNNNGIWLEDTGSMDEEAVRFFNAQFKEERVQQLLAF
ncbi:uncharacterized protein [Nicotiana tomentosiformis]|uniref:uncharacterized protein n=1 Tax=Nicotiana tomentosiformis TaxID=4098 RepID=UPI00388C4053